MQLDLLRLPFSTAGSYLVVSRLVARDLGDHRWAEYRQPDGLYLRHVHGAGEKIIARLAPTRAGRPVACDVDATPERILLRPRSRSRREQVEVHFASPTELVFSGLGLGLDLEIVHVGLFGFASPSGPDRWLLNHFVSGHQLHLHRDKGAVALDAPWDGWKCSRIRFRLTPSGDATFRARLVERVEQAAFLDRAAQPRPLDDFPAWLDSAPAAPARLARSRRLAAYVQWVSQTGPRGLQLRPALLMSKNWMPQIWSWDHCFNAMSLALAGRATDAWDNFLVVFDHQAADGKLPDTITDLSVGWNYTKAPIHGWALDWMLRHGLKLDSARLAEAYERLSAWTDWWFTHRDDDRDGIPSYNHGNDGWDNATPFKVGMPVESPDLAAYLIKQMDVLASLATRLRRSTEATAWRKRADALLERWLAHSWRGDRFAALQSGTHAEHRSDSLLTLMPLVLGRRLPAEVSAALVRHLRRPGGHLTAWGPATESPRSPDFEPDGYWRGPIWAPCVLLLITGLDDLGEHVLADTLRRRFCRLFAKSGAAENFHPITGASLRDPAYTWTASVFLILAHQLAHPTPRARA